MRTIALVLALGAGCRGHFDDDTASFDTAVPDPEFVVPDAVAPLTFPQDGSGDEPLPEGDFSGSFQALDDGAVWGAASVATGGYEVRVRVNAHGLRPGMHYGVAFFGYPTEITAIERSRCPEPGTALDEATTLGSNLYEARPLFRANEEGQLLATWTIYASDDVRRALPIEERTLVLFNITGWTHDWRHDWIGCATIQVAPDGR